MRIFPVLCRAAEGTMGELLAEQVMPAQPELPALPTMEELTSTLRDLCFIVETVAHLQGKEAALLPTAEAGRALLARLAPVTL
jgi:hypothetical protein